MQARIIFSPVGVGGTPLDQFVVYVDQSAKRLSFRGVEDRGELVRVRASEDRHMRILQAQCSVQPRELFAPDSALPLAAFPVRSAAACEMSARICCPSARYEPPHQSVARYDSLTLGRQKKSAIFVRLFKFRSSVRLTPAVMSRLRSR